MQSKKCGRNLIPHRIITIVMLIYLLLGVSFTVIINYYYSRDPTLTENNLMHLPINPRNLDTLV